MTNERWKPRVTVAAVVASENRYLLVEENVDGKRVYNQPAGHLEQGEGILDAVVRECLEETTWLFRPDYLVGIYRWQTTSPADTWLRFTFGGQMLEQRPGLALDTDITAIHWLDYAQIVERRAQLRSPLVLRSLDDYRRGLQYPLSLLQDVGN